MKREFLKGLDLEEEVINKIMAENGVDIEKAKSDLATYQTQIDTLKEQLQSANTQIEGFKDLDVEAIKAAANKYKEQYETSQSEAEDKMAQLQFNHELENAIRDSKARNIKAVKALLDTETLKGSSNRNDDLKTALEEIKASNDYLFEGEVALGTGGSLGAGGKQKVVGLTKEDLSKMSYKERVELKNTNAELYEQLSN